MSQVPTAYPFVAGGLGDSVVEVKVLQILFVHLGGVGLQSLVVVLRLAHGVDHLVRGPNGLVGEDWA